MTFQTGVLTKDDSLSRKPIILCLHGGGTNSTIFNIQTIRVQRALSKSFEFLFVDGPFDALPGPGVLPTFEGCGPFYAWIQQGRYVLLPEVMEKIENAIKGRERNVVGVMGFSQGARLAAGLLLMQQLRRNKMAFKFGIFCNGTYQPLVTEDITEDDLEELIMIPSMHFVGTEDPWYEEGLKLYHNHFDQGFATLTKFDIGHRLPVVPTDTMKIVNGIKALYEETTGMTLADFDGK